MSSDLTVLPLEECLDALIDYRGKTPVKTESGIPLITAKIIKGGRIETPTEFIAKDNYDAWMRRGIPKTGDVVLTVEAPLGEVAQLGHEKVALAQRVVTLRGKVGVLDSTYLLYLLQTEEMQSKLKARATGTTVLGIKQSELRKVELQLPPIGMQVSAAATLKALDDRIALLRETNATLEAIAQAMFKSWFVDFDPVHANATLPSPRGRGAGGEGNNASRHPHPSPLPAGEGVQSMSVATAALFPDSFEESELGLVPRGWKASTMDEVSMVGIGKTPPRKEPQWFSENAADVRWVSIRDMGISGAFISQTSEYLTTESIERFNVRQVPNNTVLLSFKMTIGRVALTDGEMTTNEAIAHFKLEEQSPLTSEYIYLHLKQFDYSILSSTSSIADAVNSKTVKAIPILVPNALLVQAFQDAVRPIFERIKLIQQQAQTLATLRDTLLPRLISGQLRLPEAEALLEELA